MTTTKASRKAKKAYWRITRYREAQIHNRIAWGQEWFDYVEMLEDYKDFN